MTQHTNLNVAVIGFYVGTAYFNKYSVHDPAPQIAAFKLEQRLVEAVSIFADEVNIISSIATRTFPKNKKLFLPSCSFVHPKGNGKIIPLINLPFFKLPSRFFGTFSGLLKLTKKPKSILIYAAHTPNLLACYFYTKLFNLPYYVYIPDLPLLMNGSTPRSRLVRFLKKFDKVLIDFLIKKSSGIIAITQHIVLDNPAWRELPYVVLEGIAPTNTDQTAEDKPTPYPIATMYAGGLSEDYGVRELVEGFIKSHVDGELWLCGGGELESYVRSVAAKNSKVKYFGFLHPSEVAELQKNAKFLVITRDPSLIYTRYSFPSKLLEYIACAVPVLSTKLDGIPEEYYPYLNVLDSHTADGVANSLQHFYNANYIELKNRSKNAKLWLNEQKTIFPASKKLLSLMQK